MIEFNFQSSRAIVFNEDYPSDEDFSNWAVFDKAASDFTDGMIATKDDPYRPLRTGFLGEAAAGYLIGQKPKRGRIENGSPEDFIHHGKNIDVKTTVKHTSRPSLMYIRIRTKSGTRLSLKCDYYWGAAIFCDSPKHIEAEIFVGGIMTREEILDRYKEQPAPMNAGHWNLVVPLADLHPYNNFIEIAEFV